MTFEAPTVVHAFAKKKPATLLKASAAVSPRMRVVSHVLSGTQSSRLANVTKAAFSIVVERAAVADPANKIAAAATNRNDDAIAPTRGTVRGTSGRRKPPCGVGRTADAAAWTGVAVKRRTARGVVSATANFFRARPPISSRQPAPGRTSPMMAGRSRCIRTSCAASGRGGCAEQNVSGPRRAARVARPHCPLQARGAQAAPEGQRSQRFRCDCERRSCLVVSGLEFPMMSIRYT